MTQSVDKAWSGQYVGVRDVDTLKCRVRPFIRFWLEFEAADGIHLSFCGCTAVDLDDALRLIGDKYYGHAATPRPIRVVADVDLSTLPEWVRTAAAPPVWRGIWYPVTGIEP